MYVEGIKLVEIPEGKFLFGTPFDEAELEKISLKYTIFPEWILKEMPQREVYLKRFWISENLITFGQLVPFFQDHPSFETIALKKYKKLYGNEHPAFPLTISLARLFCEWLTKKTLIKFSLPSEEQWEKAARGTDGREYPWGNNEDGKVNVRGRGPLKPDFSNSYENHSPYGVRFMAGNIEELTSSQNSVHVDLKIHCPENLRYPILKGGTCEHDLDLARCARRHGKIPSIYTGLRVAISFEDPASFQHTQLKIGGLSYATIIGYEKDSLIIDLGEGRVGYCSLNRISENDFKILNKSKKIGSEILVKILDKRDDLFICEKAHISDFKNYFSTKIGGVLS